jgi:hypothetical protein
LLLILFTSVLRSTPQRPDEIELDGKTYPLCAALFYSELTDSKVNEIFTEIGKVATKVNIVFLTQLRRGRVCSWKIKDKELFFEEMKIPVPTTDDDQDNYFNYKNIKTEIPNYDMKTRKYAYTGKLIVATGKLTGVNRHSTFGYVYSEYLVLKLTNGHVDSMEVAYNPNPHPSEMLIIPVDKSKLPSFQVLFCNPNRYDLNLGFPKKQDINIRNNTLKIKAFDAMPVFFDIPKSHQENNMKIMMKIHDSIDIQVVFDFVKK